MSTTIFVYAHWEIEPVLIGELRFNQVRGTEHFSTYNELVKY